MKIKLLWFASLVFIAIIVLVLINSLVEPVGVKLLLYGNTLCKEDVDTCFEIIPNKEYCFDTVCFEKPEPWQ